MIYGTRKVKLKFAPKRKEKVLDHLMMVPDQDSPLQKNSKKVCWQNMHSSSQLNCCMGMEVLFCDGAWDCAPNYKMQKKFHSTALKSTSDRKQHLLMIDMTISRYDGSFHTFLVTLGHFESYFCTDMYLCNKFMIFLLTIY